MFIKKYLTLIFCSSLMAATFIAATAEARDISFSWAANQEQVDGYKLYYDTDTGGAPYDGTGAQEGSSPIIFYGQQNTEATLHGLSDTATYHFSLTAFQGEEQSDYSAEITVQPESSSNTNGEITAHFAWTPNTESNLSGYKIHYGTAHGIYTKIADIGNPTIGDDNKVHGDIASLIEGTTYYFVCTAYDDQGNESGYSQEIEWTATGESTTDPLVADDAGVSTVNNPPQANSTSINITGDTPFSGQLQGSDPDNDPLTFSRISTPGKGSVIVNSSGSFTYTPNSNQTGTDSFTFEVNDGQLSSKPATVSITLTAINHPPITNSGAIATSENTSISGQLNANDEDGDTLTYTIVNNGSLGTASITNAQTGTFTYTPNQNAVGTDSFTFKVNDGSVNSANGSISVTITKNNQPPTAQAASFTASGTSPISGRLNGSDPDGDVLTFIVVSQPEKGHLSLNASGTFTYTPDQNASGSDTFTFKVNDGSVNSSAATATIILNDSKKSAQFEWAPSPEQVEGYRLYYKIDTQGGPDYNGTGANEGDSPIDVGNVTHFNITGLEPNKRYYFAITAYIGAEESAYSKEIILWTGDNPAAPIIMNIIDVK